MSNLAQVDKIVKQVATLKADDKINENVTMKSAFGLWKNRNINEKELRKKAWKIRVND